MNDITKLIAKLSPEKRALLAMQLKKRSEFNIFPLSFAQQRIWFLDQLNPGSDTYNVPTAFMVSGRLDPAVLRQSLSEVVKRHESLRATFVMVDEEPMQVISPALPLEMPLVDLTALREPEREAEAMRVASQEAQQAFDLARGPLLRLKLLRLDQQTHVILLTMHHIVSDAWSIGVLIREASLLYEAFSAGLPSPLPKLAVQYADYARWQRDWLQGDVLEAELSYWENQLSGSLPLIEWPTGRPRPQVRSSRGTTYSFVVPEALSESLRRFSHKEGVTLFTTLLTAFNALLYRYTKQEDLIVGTPITNRNRAELEGLIGLFLNVLVLRTDASGDPTFRELLRRVSGVILGALEHKDMPFEKLVEQLQPERDLSRTPLFQVMFTLQNTSATHLNLSGLNITALSPAGEVAKFDLTLSMEDGGGEIGADLEYNTDIFDAEMISRLAAHFQKLLEAITTAPDGRISELRMLTRAELDQLLIEWNATARQYPVDKSIQQLFEQQVERNASGMAVAYEAERLSYEELNRRANQLAHHLRRMGVGPEVLVGICIERSIEMVVGLLGILKAGGVYLPLDPNYPKERLEFMLEDAQVRVLVTDQWQAVKLTSYKGQAVRMDSDWETIASESEANLSCNVMADDLAYVIYTSGSTGKPKGVMVSHRNVVNFFAGMDDCIGSEPAGTWLAVTSISFDISVLELLWTLTRGFRVVVQAEHYGAARAIAPTGEASARKMDFSLFYFASNDEQTASQKYRLLIEGAKYADTHGFTAIWTPERHFHQFGGLFPNPSVTSAGIATITERVQIRAGSVVLPLHNTLRVAEEWIVVDNLSAGRVGISFASGWQANDFVLAPQNYADRRELMFREVERLRRLWRGESILCRGVGGKDVEVKVFPRPVQSELPVWITAGGSPETFRMAGEIGAGVLTHLLGQTVEELEEKISIYRNAWRAGGHSPDAGHVSLMLHTFIGADMDVVREKVRKPFCDYLRSSVDLIKSLARSWGQDLDVESFTEDDMQALLDHGFDRYFQSSGLLGTPTTCIEMIERLKAIGVDEVACLIDFGVDIDSVLSSLDFLTLLKDRSNIKRDGKNYSLPAQVGRYGVTHLQCTPSMAKMISLDADSLDALRSLQRLMIGGEALSSSLVDDLFDNSVTADVLNMYGPTETTIWSSTHRVNGSGSRVSIGRPISNTVIYILDDHLQPVPVGATGDLYIGGESVARGYLNRPELTAERFIPNPFNRDCYTRLYKTGDLARYMSDGNIEYVGRTDQQVKIRGYRIELGEIEAALRQHEQIQEAVVGCEELRSETRLIGYVVMKNGEQPASDELRRYLKARLPDYMVPVSFVVLQEMPLTPNGKIDRNRLPSAGEVKAELKASFVAPNDIIELELAHIWEDIIGLRPIGIKDNFFDIGGHSLSAVRLTVRIQEHFGQHVPLAVLFQGPTIEHLAKVLRQNAGSRPISALAAIQPNGNKLPFFAVHPMGGQVICYYQLARHLGSDRPFYGLQAPELARLGELDDFYLSIEEMAAQYVEAICALWPQGPYLLGGLSFGGIVAFEMAQQLRAQKKEVALLALFDTLAPIIKGEDSDAALLAGIVRDLASHNGKDLMITAEELESLEPDEQLDYVLERVIETELVPMDVERAVALTWMRKVLKGWHNRSRALQDYAPKLYPGRITLIRAGEINPAHLKDESMREVADLYLNDPTSGWSQFSTEPVDLHVASGYHETMLTEPYVRVLAERLRACIENSEME